MLKPRTTRIAQQRQPVVASSGGVRMARDRYGNDIGLLSQRQQPISVPRREIPKIAPVPLLRHPIEQSRSG